MNARTVALLGTFLLTAGAAQAQTPAPANILEQSSEYRFQLDFHVNDAALAKLLPAGWESNAATAGAAKDANLRLIFVDCVNITGADNKPLGKGTNHIAMLAIPVKQSGGAVTGQMIIGGISEDAATPDSSLYLKSTASKVTRNAASVNGAVTVTEDWDFTAAGGEHLQMHVKYTPAAASKGKGETQFYDPADPSKVLVLATEQMTDITRNATTTPPDRVAEFSYKAGGGKFAALFDGSEKPLSWDSQPVYSRIVTAP